MSNAFAPAAPQRSGPRARAAAALRAHAPEYAMEAAELALFMVCACAFTALLEHPDSPLRRALPDPLPRRGLIGVAMGLTAIGIIHSPWGQRSGAHLNPALTLTYWRLGKTAPADALFYVAAQFCGGVLGVAAAAGALGSALADPAVQFAVTVPGARGAAAAFAAETAISFGLMWTVLATSNQARLARYTPVFAGLLIAVYITVEAPISGMSMNPARSFGSAAIARQFRGLWIYFSAPLFGMLLAAEPHVRTGGAVRCAKLHHHNAKRCIFRCGYAAAAGELPAEPAG